jgi:hypothetical protein
MANSPPIRRSTRKRKPNTKYAGAEWSRDALRRTRAVPSLKRSSPDNSDINLEPSHDEGFYGVRDDGTLDDSSNFDSGLDVSGRLSSSESEDVQDIGARKEVRDVDNLTGPLEIMYPLVHGNHQDDLASIRHAESIWLRGRDATLPSRTTLLNPESSFMHLVEADRRRAAKVALAEPGNLDLDLEKKEELSKMAFDLNNQSHVDDGQLSQLVLRQRFTEIDKQTATSRGYITAADDHTVVAGPLHSQRAYVVDALDCHPLQTSASPDESSSWLINVGEKVQCAAWALTPGATQYLALVARCPPQQREVSGASATRSFGPAFTISTSCPCNIQMWAFHGKAATQDDGLLSLDTSITPRLEQVIGINAGDVRELKWAPTDSRITDAGLPHLLATLSTDSHVRILACDLPDGSQGTRWLELLDPVADISPPANLTTSPIIRGEEPVFSTFSWLSSHELVIGRSNGLTFSYDIVEVLNSPPQSRTADANASLTPYQTLFPHQTNITAISPARPLLPPTHRFIATSSAIGDLNLTQLTPAHPSTTVHTYRQRLPSRLLTYSPYTRTFLTICPANGLHSSNTNHTADAAAGETLSTPILTAHHLRRFASDTQQLAQLPLEGGAATALAEMSVHHPCVLMGNAGGEVWATNYLRTVLGTERRDRSGEGAWSLKVVRADWREDIGPSLREIEQAEEAEGDVVMAESGESALPSTAATNATNDHGPKSGYMPSTAARYHGQPTRKGITRLVLGWRATPVELRGYERKNKKKQQNGKKRGWRKKSGEDEDQADDHPANADTDMPDPEDDAISPVAATSTLSTSASSQQGTVRSTSTKATTKAIFEEEQAVTALAWSKDCRTAGWAAVGWGSGLVMVRDLAV